MYFFALVLLLGGVAVESMFEENYLQHFKQFKKDFHVRYRSNEEEAKR